MVGRRNGQEDGVNINDQKAIFIEKLKGGSNTRRAGVCLEMDGVSRDELDIVFIEKLDGAFISEMKEVYKSGAEGVYVEELRGVAFLTNWS